jgi:Zn-dependent protease with chaperone function
MDRRSEEQEYAKIKRRINILGALIFVGSTATFILIATQVFNAAWANWWLWPGGLLFGFSIALASSVVMDYAIGREYQLVDLPLWEYVLVRFRFLLVLFLIPMTIAVVTGLLVNTFYEGTLEWTIVLARGVAFVVLILFAGYVLPYLFGRITGAERVGRDTTSLVKEIAEKIGVTIQGVYKVPLKGLREVNAVQIGFLEGRKVVYVLGGWEQHFTRSEYGAVLAHEFTHAKHNHIRKLLLIQLLCRIGVPGLIFIIISFTITAFQIPKPAPMGVVLAFLIPALVALVVSALCPAWISRKYEYQADSRAAKVCGTSAMRSALRKLAALNMIPKEKSHLLSTHPSIENRIGALKNS